MCRKNRKKAAETMGKKSFLDPANNKCNIFAAHLS
jgi:hypothetical protein